MNKSPIIELTHVKTWVQGKWLHQDINLAIQTGEIIGIVGGSGCGKTTLLREILMLQPPTRGSIKIFNREVTTASYAELLKIQQRFGVCFQQNALFSSFTVLENVAFPLQEHARLDKETRQSLALLKILLAGLRTDTAHLYPAELSGGMQKRAALARAIALDPEIVFLDEPTAGLDPESAAGLDELILNLRDTMGLTIVLITHDVDSLWRVTDRVAFLGEGRVLCIDSMPALVCHSHPLIQAFFKGPRGKVTKGDNEWKPK